MNNIDSTQDGENKLRYRLKKSLSQVYYMSLLRSILPDINDKEDAVGLYLSNPACRVFSLNPFFDETFYRGAYKDITDSIINGDLLSGLVHFIVHGHKEGRMPNRALYQTVSSCIFPLKNINNANDIPKGLFTSENYLNFSQYFPFVDPLIYFNNFGRYFTSQGENAVNFTEMARVLFDPEFYNAKYIKDDSLTTDQLFNNYMTAGLANQRSPNADFDEQFYLAFYSDIRKVVKDGRFRCGFQHFLIAGEKEGRLGKYDATSALEAQIPGITHPIAVHRVDDLEKKLEMTFFLDTTRTERTINIVLPNLNPDIFFGGYDSLVNMIIILKKLGKKLRIIKSESIDPTLDYLLYHWQGKPRGLVFIDIDVCGRNDLVAIGSDDRFITYSVWDAYLATKMASVTNCKRFVYLIQEYEPIFMEFNSLHFLSNAAYAFPHYAIFNSPELKDFFRSKELGVFAKTKPAEEVTDYSILNHVLTPLECGLDGEKRKNRNFFYYARPESHAGRNLFEIGILALRKMLREHSVGKEWRFIGIGALTPQNYVLLEGGHIMDIKNKLPIDEYIQLTRETDIAFSLMWAPHPSLVPYEMLQTGAVVVTNTFENRPKEHIERLSLNIIAAEPTLDALTEALWEAFQRSDNFEERKAGVVRLGPDNWDQAFSPIIDNLHKEDLI